MPGEKHEPDARLRGERACRGKPDGAEPAGDDPHVAVADGRCRGVERDRVVAKDPATAAAQRHRLCVRGALQLGDQAIDLIGRDRRVSPFEVDVAAADVRVLLRDHTERSGYQRAQRIERLCANDVMKVGGDDLEANRREDALIAERLGDGDEIGEGALRHAEIGGQRTRRAAVHDRVEAGQVLCILEAMKLFNEITSDYSGIVTRIVPENGELVSLGQELFWIEP